MKRGMYAIALLAALPAIMGLACNGHAGTQEPASNQAAATPSGFQMNEFWKQADDILGGPAGGKHFAQPYIDLQNSVKPQYEKMSYQEKDSALVSFLQDPYSKNPEQRAIAELAAQEIAGRMVSEDFGISFSPNPVVFQNEPMEHLVCRGERSSRIYGSIDSSELAKVNALAAPLGFSCYVDPNIEVSGLDGTAVVVVTLGDSFELTLDNLGHEMGHTASRSDGRLIPYSPNFDSAGEETFMNMYGPWFAGRFLREHPGLLASANPNTHAYIFSQNPEMEISPNSKGLDAPQYTDYSFAQVVNCLRYSGGWPLAFSTMNTIEGPEQLQKARDQYCSLMPKPTTGPTTNPTLFTQGAATYYSVTPGLQIPGASSSYSGACVPANMRSAEDVAKKAWSKNGGGEPAGDYTNILFIMNNGSTLCGQGYYAVPDTNGDGLVGVAP